MQNEENNGADVPVIDRGKSKRMLVWDYQESAAEERMVICKCRDIEYPYLVISKNGKSAVEFKHAKPLPESRPMKTMDVLYWHDLQIKDNEVVVTKHKDTEGFDDSFPVDLTDELAFINHRWNILIRENGTTYLKYGNWKEFNFDNCNLD